ncbi:helix-turn-helix domain-containing protein [Leuconostoc gelidum subsp. aenigmaticum]|uniref:helix-turn-helix domain-containing protein n=1 Tax=Leuconostoc gelidum TaxID=1244 RepID=UPI001CC58124|nr:helix-turn-helix domain-containing protein [Leuconostoc gelidum]MBZ6002751.1 helix-turn-helix domain-containing protein [Leuconostoc gelidum subsp. aenigmaticum]
MLLQLHFSIRAIARFLGRSPSTIAHEIKRTIPYNVHIVDQLAQQNAYLCGLIKIKLL